MFQNFQKHKKTEKSHTDWKKLINSFEMQKNDMPHDYL